MKLWRPIVLVLISTGLVAVVVRNANRETPAGQIKELASAPEARDQRAIWKPTPEQQALLDQAARTPPDPISDELVPVLAAIHEDYRKLIFFDKLESDFYLAARSWALRDGYVTGDPREVDMFVNILNKPISDNSRAAARPDARDFALIALKHATIARDPHRRRFQEFEHLALAHIDTEYDHNAILILYP